MLRPAATVTLAGVLALAAGTGHAGQDAADWLMKINRAARELSYSGTFVSVQGNQLDTMRVVHQARHGMVRERLYSLNGAPREIIRDEEQVWCFLPDEKIGVHEYRQASESGFPRILPDDTAQLQLYYTIELGGADRFANRDAQQIRIQPNDEFRYGYDLWADRATGLLLRTELLDIDNSPIENYTFVDVSIGVEISDADLQPMTAREDLVWFGPERDPPAGQPSPLGWMVGTVPPGFELSQKISRTSPMRRQPVEHYVYSDGLASVSIFIEKRPPGAKARAMQGLSRMGAVHAFGKMAGDFQITVMGEVPGDTVKLIAASVAQE